MPSDIDLVEMLQLANDAPHRPSLALGYGEATPSEKFYAAAKVAVPALVARVEELERDRDCLAAELAEARGECARLEALCAGYRKLNEISHEECDRLGVPDPASSLGTLIERIRALVSERDAALARAGELEFERDTYRAMLCDLMAKARRHTVDSTMTELWNRTRELLKNGPDLDRYRATKKEPSK